MTDKSAIADMEKLFQGFADRTRLRLLNLMADQEICVCYFVEILDGRSRRYRGTWRISGVQGWLRLGAKGSGCTIASPSPKTRLPDSC